MDFLIKINTNSSATHRVVASLWGDTSTLFRWISVLFLLLLIIIIALIVITIIDDDAWSSYMAAVGVRLLIIRELTMGSGEVAAVNLSLI